MSLFLTESRRREILEARRRENPAICRFWTDLMERTATRAASPGLLGGQDDATWWYPAAEYLSDAAMAWALEPTANLGAWLRDATL
ncbi:MAG: hypothetical protein U1E05_14855, partial [Patescibacteria group bacterium]|nr:hypothetical protein [Patescibacteria group bacterium]